MAAGRGLAAARVSTRRPTIPSCDANWPKRCGNAAPRTRPCRTPRPPSGSSRAMPRWPFAPAKWRSRSGAHDAALAKAEDAIRIDPHLAGAWALRGRAFRKMNQPDRALADLQRALVFDPDNAAILFELAMMYREHGDHARCLTTLHHLHDTYPPGEEPQNTLLLEGLTLMELKRPLQAAEVLLTATQRGPANADLLFHLAQAQSAAGQRAEADGRPPAGIRGRRHAPAEPCAARPVGRTAGQRRAATAVEDRGGERSMIE